MHRRPGGDSGRAGHADVLDRYQGQLSWPGVKGTNLGGGARGCRAEVAERIVDAKKEVTGADAEQLLTGSGWLPLILRVPQANHPMEASNTDSLTIPPAPITAD